MEDYLHAAKLERHSAVELAQSYLKGYAATWWRTMRQEEGKNHGYTWEFFKERVEVEFVPRNSDYISRCKLRDLVNATNDNLWQYVRVYSELMLEIQHMHELDRMCQFVMGLPTWAKRKLEENWPSSLSKAIMKVEGFSDVGRGEKSGFKKDNKFLHKKPRHEGEWNRGQGNPRKEKPKQFQGSGFKPKGDFMKEGVPFKGSQPKGDVGGKLKEHVLTAMKWGTIPKIVPSPKRGMEALRGFSQLHNPRKRQKDGAPLGEAQGTHQGALHGWGSPTHYVTSKGSAFPTKKLERKGGLVGFCLGWNGLRFGNGVHHPKQCAHRRAQ
jgi:hypothetical protein